MLVLIERAYVTSYYFGSVSVAPDRPCWDLQGFKLAAVKLFAKYSSLCDHGT